MSAHIANPLAAQAAARVAARYAKAPSYSEMLADEARAAVRAAEAASEAAQKAQVAVEAVLAGLGVASGDTSAWESDMAQYEAVEQVQDSVQEPVFDSVQEAAPVSSQSSEMLPFDIRWEPDMPVRSAAPVAVHASHEPKSVEPAAEDWSLLPALEAQSAETVEPALPIHANLIEFPRELVATRKVRPRLAEAAASEEPERQLSIFEVDPSTISTEPMVEAVAAEAAAPVPVGPRWSGMELDAHPEEERAEAQETARVLPPKSAQLQDVSMGMRLMAAIVDGALITGAFFAAAWVAAANVQPLPALRSIELGAAVALFVTGLLYQAFFFTLGEATPGMRYAHIALCTFAGAKPSRAQRCGRWVALLLSVLPVGLGLAWALFDDDHLTWHDRLSRTYLRKY
jgi:uncharacterized RDD family membrane protein YckC